MAPAIASTAERKTKEEGGREGNSYIPHFKKSLHPKNWAVRQGNFLSKYFQEELGKKTVQFKAWLKPDLLCQAFSKFPSTQ